MKYLGYEDFLQYIMDKKKPDAKIDGIFPVFYSALLVKNITVVSAHGIWSADPGSEHSIKMAAIGDNKFLAVTASDHQSVSSKVGGNINHPVNMTSLMLISTEPFQ